MFCSATPGRIKNGLLHNVHSAAAAAGAVAAGGAAAAAAERLVQDTE